MKLTFLKNLKTLLFVFCGFVFVLQTTACKQDELPQNASQEKDQPHKPGPGEGGGGDPDAQRFIFLSLKLSRFYTENPANLSLPFSADEFAAKVQTLDSSLKDPAINDLVFFTDASLFDQNGIPKVALFDRRSGTIQVNRTYWGTASDEDKFIMLHMEIAGLLGIDVRYEQALALIKDRAALIFAMPVAEAGESTPIGWWIAEQDPNIFARISTNDILIDGGTVGTGSETNLRVVEFLKNPTADREWFALAEQAFSKGLPAYLLLRDPLGERASLTAFRKTATSFPTYTLLFYTKSKPVGLCDHSSDQLSPLERIKNCLFDTRFYQTGDTQSTFEQLSKRLESHYAYSTDTLEAALQFYLIQDYSGLFTPQFRQYVLWKTALAHGLVTTLSKSEVSFWQLTDSLSESDLRFYKALEKMAQERLGFYPGQHPNCIYFDANGNQQYSTDREPSLVALSELHRMIQLDECLSRSADGLDARFYHSLVRHGFVYNPTTHEWSKSTPRTTSPRLLQSQFRVVNEIETKILTENLSSIASEQLILQHLNSSDFEQRILVYELLPRWSLLGLQQDQAIRLYRQALRDVREAPRNSKTDPQNLEWVISDVFPLEDFAEANASLAIHGRLISEDFSREALSEIFQVSWLNSRIAQNILTSTTAPRSEQSSSIFEFALTTLMQQSYFDKDLAQSIYSQIRDAETISPAIRLRLLNALLRTGMSFTETAQEWILLQQRLNLSSDIERRTHSQNLNSEQQAELYLEALRTSKNAAAVGPLLKKFLSENTISTGLLKTLFDEFMQLILRDSEPSNGLRELAMMSFQVSMTPAQRESLYRFIFLSFHNNEDKGARAYLLFEMQYVSHQTLEVRQSYQLLYELTAQSSRQKIGEVGLLPELEAMDSTEARDLVRTIESCRTPYPTQICEYITSPNRILSLIATNSLISEQTRLAARLELRWRH